MTTQDVHVPTLGAQGEPCPSCRSPLAADQRYCLQCGARRAEARLAFREILGAQAPIGPHPPLAPPVARAYDEPPQRAGLAFLAGLLCLLIALGVGVLIGRSGHDTPTAAAPAPAPQVITVGGSAPAAATTPAATTPAKSTPSKSAPGKSAPAGKSSGGSSKATNKSLKSLDNSSGSDFEKKSGKLPKQVGTGGKPPLKDNKPAGGGSNFQEIG